MTLGEMIYIGLDIVTLLMLPVLVLALIAITWQGFQNLFGGDKAIPFLPTSRRIIDQMLVVGNVKDGERLVDLGAGTGRIVIYAAHKFKVDAVGVEINPFLHYWAKMRGFFAQKEGTVKFLLGNMINHDLKDYDVVMLFVTGTFMNKYLKIGLSGAFI